jgi:aryl-alcohol dehydrogenase-like predicted oxidoreductase
MPFPRLIFGTASLASNYGISNPKADNDEKRTRELILTAEKIGISNFDTAPVYGDAELLLGKYLEKKSIIQVDSKISSADCNSFNSILDSIKSSLDKIQIEIGRAHV